ncbi:hypothetical protein ACQKMD_21495, partial [Viridibacillus sp. NPDC096237]|uniref:hypothetical protein n=1 Tax=Viridibacillus sp. NPDC096237 TaxID=3390721 RepID=UPI003D089092
FYLTEGNTVIKEKELKAFLNKQLPDFMVPNYFFCGKKFFSLHPMSQIPPLNPYVIVLLISLAILFVRRISKGVKRDFL